VRNYALKNQILDVPNQRSSHSAPTPSSGGIAIIATWFCGSLLLASVGLIDVVTAVEFLPPALLVAAVGFFDDQRHLSPWVRLAAHFASAAWFFFFAGHSVTTGVAFFDESSVILMVLCVIGLVWFINLFNFMDGIDGLASMEAIFFSFSIALLCWSTGVHEILAISILLGATCAGFLVWNWPPAKIFMGDTGSSTLGFLIGAIALGCSSGTDISVWPGIILLGVFFVDATVTLIRRALSGQVWYEPHRSHAYQKMAIRRGSHRSITIGVLAINCFWLLPMAAWAVLSPEWSVFIAGLALAPLIVVALLIGAGSEDRSNMVPRD
jgi:Fuc2NAc and GlcNAc transferase